MQHASTVPDIRARELLTVIALAEYGSFVAASAYLKVSQPAITRTLKHLERALGVTLFSRTTRRVEITPAGREFVAVAERMLNDLQISMRNMREVASEQRGQVIVSTYSAFACRPLPSIIEAFRDGRPQVEVRIREGRQPDILEDVRSGVADFGIGFVDTLPDTVESTTLRRESLYAAFPPGHRVAKRRTAKVRLDALQHETLVSLPLDSYTRRLVDGAAMAAGFALRHSLIVTRFETVLQYVASGAGVGIIPAGAVPPPGGRSCHAALLVSPTLSVTLGLMTLRGRFITPLAASLIALIRAYYRPARRAATGDAPAPPPLPL